MEFLYVKSLHIIFVVTWFAGLFYMPRFFVYFAEANEKEEPAKSILQTQYKLMSKRLWYMITWPSAVLCTFFAVWMLWLQPVYLTMGWMQVKLSFVFALFFYHGFCQRIYTQMQNDVVNYSAFKFRVLNEVSTIILFAVVFLVVIRDQMSWIWGVIGILLFGIILMLSIKLYKRIRANKSWDKSDREPNNNE